MVLLLLASLPSLLLPDFAPLPFGGLGLVCLGPPLLYAVSQQRLHVDWGRRMLALPLLVLIGIGIAWENTRAVGRGLIHWGGVFARTPKFRLEGQDDRWANSGYRLRADVHTVVEAALALYALATALVAHATGNHGAIPFSLVYALAFGTVAGLGLVQTLAPRRRHSLRSVRQDVAKEC
jgi:hypothetical protein